MFTITNEKDHGLINYTSDTVNLCYKWVCEAGTVLDSETKACETHLNNLFNSIYADLIKVDGYQFSTYVEFLLGVEENDGIVNFAFMKAKIGFVNTNMVVGDLFFVEHDAVIRNNQLVVQTANGEKSANMYDFEYLFLSTDDENEMVALFEETINEKYWYEVSLYPEYLLGSNDRLMHVLRVSVPERDIRFYVTTKNKDAVVNEQRKLCLSEGCADTFDYFRIVGLHGKPGVVSPDGNVVYVDGTVDRFTLSTVFEYDLFRQAAFGGTVSNQGTPGANEDGHFIAVTHPDGDDVFWLFGFRSVTGVTRLLSFGTI